MIRKGRKFEKKLVRNKVESLIRKLCIPEKEKKEKKRISKVSVS